MDAVCYNTTCDGIRRQTGVTLLIHIFVILFVFTRSDVIHPLPIIEVPTDSLFNTFLKLKT